MSVVQANELVGWRLVHYCFIFKFCARCLHKFKSREQRNTAHHVTVRPKIFSFDHVLYFYGKNRPYDKIKILDYANKSRDHSRLRKFLSQLKSTCPSIFRKCEQVRLPRFFGTTTQLFNILQFFESSPLKCIHVPNPYFIRDHNLSIEKFSNLISSNFKELQFFDLSNNVPTAGSSQIKMLTNVFLHFQGVIFLLSCKFLESSSKKFWT